MSGGPVSIFHFQPSLPFGQYQIILLGDSMNDFHQVAASREGGTGIAGSQSHDLSLMPEHYITVPRTPYCTGRLHCHKYSRNGFSAKVSQTNQNYPELSLNIKVSLFAMNCCIFVSKCRLLSLGLTEFAS